MPWTGVTCSDGAPQRVRALNLSCTPLCYTLGGTLPAELAGASALEIISLQSNRISELWGGWEGGGGREGGGRGEGGGGREGEGSMHCCGRSQFAAPTAAAVSQPCPCSLPPCPFWLLRRRHPPP